MQRIPFDLEIYRNKMEVFLKPAKNSELFWQALYFAAEAHEDQWRRSGEAYIMHPCSVAMILADEMDVVDPEILAAALLHDTIEDVEEVTVEVVAERFGSYVAAIVEGCTKVTHYSGDKQTQYKMIHRKIFSGAAARPEVMLVKLSDRLHNLRTLSAMPKHKRQKIADETLDVYAPLATVLGLFSLKREMYTLALSFKFPKQGAKLLGHIKKLDQSRVAIEMVEQLQRETSDVWLNCEVDYRTKGLWAYYDKTNRILLKQIDNPVEVILIVDDIQSCYRALGIVNQTFPPIPRTIRDFIANPKPTGYQGLHARTNIKGQKFLLKIRTKEMARRAQRGLFRNWSSRNSEQLNFIHEIKEMFGVIGSEDSVSYREVIAASQKKEIYTYTPQGDLICLPVNSTVLDFAFRVHTDIGHSCVGAMIGNRRVDQRYVLQDGDVARVIREEHSVRFDPELLDLCQTPRARAELTKAFRFRRKQVASEVGFAIVTQEMLRYGLPLDLIYKDEMEKVFQVYRVADLEGLYCEIGEGKIRLGDLIKNVKELLFDGVSPLAPPTGAFNRIELTTLDPASIKLSACCKPMPTDRGLCGLLSERGLSVHHKSCPRFRKIQFQREDAVELIWKQRETEVSKKQTLVFMEAARGKIMLAAAEAPEKMTIQDLVMLSRTPTPNPAWELSFNVPDLYVLRKVMRHFDKSGLLYEFELER